MSADRAPWWYSGDEADEAGPAPADAVAAELTDSPGAPDDPGPEAAQDARSADWSALALGAQRLVDWASERILAPHAEHADPREHPECVVCRTQLLLGEGSVPAGAPGGDGPADGAGDAPTDEAEGGPAAPGPGSGDPGASRPVIAWIAIVEAEEPAGPRPGAD